jgi:hypothetical protein
MVVGDQRENPTRTFSRGALLLCLKCASRHYSTTVSLQKDARDVDDCMRSMHSARNHAALRQIHGDRSKVTAMATQHARRALLCSSATANCD